MAFVLSNPALANLMQRRRVEVMQLLATLPNGGDEVRRFQQGKVLGDSLPRHVEVAAQFGQGLAVILVQLIEQPSAAGISQCFEHCIHLRDNMQSVGFMSSNQNQTASSGSGL